MPRACWEKANTKLSGGCEEWGWGGNTCTRLHSSPTLTASLSDTDEVARCESLYRFSSDPTTDTEKRE